MNSPMRKLALSAVLLFLLSGCFGGGGDKESGPDTPEPTDEGQGNVTVDPGNETGGNETVPREPDLLQLEGCEEWRFFLSNTPGQVLPGEAPEGWEPDDPTSPLASIAAGGYRCEKLSLGPLERGPIRIVTDLHSNMDIPEECDEVFNINSVTYILHTIFVDDPELQSYLNRTYKMPAVLAEISESPQTIGTATYHAVEWTGENGLTSQLSILDDGQQSPYPDEYTVYFWPTPNGGLGRLKMLEHISRFGEYETLGHFEPPMVLAEFNGGDVPGMAGWYPDSSAEGEFTHYKDHYCTE